MSTLDFQYMRHGLFNSTSKSSECILWVNSSHWMSYDGKNTITLSGKAFLHRKLRRELQRGIGPKVGTARPDTRLPKCGWAGAIIEVSGTFRQEQ